MATAGELIEEISDTVLDDRYDDDAIIKLLNKANLYVASVAFLPDLETSATVTTLAGLSSVPLPEDFHRNLFNVSAADPIANSGKIKLFGSVAAMVPQFRGTLDKVGTRVVAAARYRKELTYALIPETPEVLNIRYYRVPAIMETDLDEPEGIPDAFHDILIHRVCYNLFSKIEDGTEGDKVNTKFHYGQMTSLMESLTLFIKDGMSFPDAPVVAGEFL